MATADNMEKMVFRPKDLDELVTWYENGLRHLEDVAPGLQKGYMETLNGLFQEHALRLRAQGLAGE